MGEPKFKNQDLPELEQNELDFAPGWVLKFDTRELLANRAGWMTKRQRRYLLGRLETVCLELFLAFWFGGLFVCALTVPPQDLGSTPASASKAAFTSAVFAILLFLLAASTAARILLDARAGIVNMVAGCAQTHVKKSGRRVRYWLSIDDTTFEVDKDTLLVFHSGEPYQVYYTPHTKTVLSAEPVKAKRGV